MKGAVHLIARDSPAELFDVFASRCEQFVVDNPGLAGGTLVQEMLRRLVAETGDVYGLLAVLQDGKAIAHSLAMLQEYGPDRWVFWAQIKVDGLARRKLVRCLIDRTEMWGRLKGATRAIGLCRRDWAVSYGYQVTQVVVEKEL